MREWPELQRIASVLGGSVMGLPMTGDSVMYNSGVMGLHPQDAELLLRALAATRAMRAHSSLFTCNQISASIVFAGGSRLSTCVDLPEQY